MPSSTSSVPKLLFGVSYHLPNLYHAVHFLAPDPIVVIDFPDGHTALWVQPLEEGRAKKESTAEEVHSNTEIGVSSLMQKAGSEQAMWPLVVDEVCAHHHLEHVVVDGTFPYGIAEVLRSRGVQVDVDWSMYMQERRIKNAEQIGWLAQVETIGLGGLQVAIDMITDSTVVDDLLVYDGKTLTGEMLVHAVEAYFHDHECSTVDSICCGGPESADPHRLTSPVIRANLPIVLDLYPYHRTTRYWGDLTRTVVKGTPPDRVRDMFEAVKEAQENAVSMVRPGVNTRDIHRSCCDVFSGRGYGSATPPYDQIVSSARFIHGTGHGVGLEIHEFPRVSDPDVILQEGDVITIEPGLYDPEFGGIRIEDLIVVTSSGARNLTEYPKSLELSQQRVRQTS